jgi:DNA-binding MarR family transcriptional regulator
MNVRAQQDVTHGRESRQGFVSNYLLYLLAAASDKASADFHVQVRARGLRVSEWRVLACLSDRDGLMVTQLAQLALMEQSRLTKIIDQMAASDLVTRANDERDRRRVRVFLTAKGRRSAEDLVAVAKAHEAHIADQLAPGDAELLKDALRRINALFGEGDATSGAHTDRGRVAI